MAGGYGHVLLSIYLIGYGAGIHLAAQARFPKQGAGAGVQSVEITLASAREEQIAGRGEDSAVGGVRHQKLPLLFARARIEGDYRTVAGFFGPRVDRSAPQ